MANKSPSEKQKKRLAKFLTSDEKPELVSSIGKRYFWIKVILIFIIPLIWFYASFLMLLGFFDIQGYSYLKYFGIFPLFVLIAKLKSSSQLIRQKQSYIYALTNKRLLIITGIFSRKILSAPLERITHVTVEQSVAQRYLYNNGNLVVITAGYDQREIVIENIGDPVKFKIMIEELSDRDDTKEEDDTPIRKL
ncbi:MAG: PH domain-containing protein [Candidatus Curtissbacteria bacterium]|nr:PH domain-containing protein [Candidatus Curtissbacteria bacterium]